MNLRDEITVLISTSPIPSHPSTAILDETIQSIRFHLPESEILVMCDGVRPEQEIRRKDYGEYLHRLLWKCNHEYRNILPIIHEEFLHQALMTKQVLNEVRTPLILFMEHDTPLVTDEPILWEVCARTIQDGFCNSIRFLHEAGILDEHSYLMRGRDKYLRQDFVKTVQWSQRPHLASTEFYRQILKENFNENSRTFIEDKMHSVVQCAPWERYKLVIYAPPGNMKHSLHSDGRAGERKAECVF